jgi:hypothetical protein
MLCEIRFVTRGGKYDKTFAKKQRECRDLAEALRWAAACVKQSAEQDVQAITSVRIRVVPTAQQEPAPLIAAPALVPSEPAIVELPRARGRKSGNAR